MKQKNDEAILFGLPKEDAEMKVDEIEDKNENTLSDHQSAQDVSDNNVTGTPTKVHAEKMSDIDRQIQEIERAIAIQKEVTARKMKEAEDAKILEKAE